MSAHPSGCGYVSLCDVVKCKQLLGNGRIGCCSVVASGVLPIRMWVAMFCALYHGSC